MASGRPITSFTLSLEAREIIGQLAEHYNLSRSAVVELAVRELQKKMR
jgi:predicted transcriptional regulator